MPRHSKQPSSANLMRVPGERIPTWLAVMFAVLGTTASVLVAQRMLPGDMEIRLGYHALTERLTTGLQDAGAARPSTTAPMAQPRPSGDDPPSAQAAATPVTMPEPEPHSMLAGAGTDQVMPPAHGISQVSQTPVEVAAVASDAAPAVTPLTDATPGAGADTSLPPSPPAGGLAEVRVMAAPTAAGPSPPDAVHPTPTDAPANGLAMPAAAETRAVSTIVCPSVMEIGFSKSSTKPRADGLDHTLAQLREAVESHPAVTLRVEGHADASGPAEFNLVLSYRRAVAVAKLLIEAGIAPERVVTHAYGEETDDGPSDEQGNRRVVVRIEGMGSCLKGFHYAEMN